MKGVAFCDYDNYHAYSILDGVEHIEKYHFLDRPPWRVGPDWEKKRSRKTRFCDFKMLYNLYQSDYIIFWGVFNPFPLVMFLFVLSCIGGKRVLLCSEGFKKEKSKLVLFLFRTLTKVIPQKKLSILSIGNGSDRDYKDIGFINAEYVKFGFFENYPDVIVEDTILSKKYDTLNTEPLRILYVGQLIERKNIKKLLASSKYCSRSVIIEVAGGGDMMSDLMSLSVELPANIKVNFHGHCNPDDLDILFKKSHLFVLPSSYEGWGVVVNQAIHYGLPIFLSSNVRSGKGYLYTGSNGFLFDDVESFYMKVNSLTIQELNEMSVASLVHSRLWHSSTVFNKLYTYAQYNIAEPSGPLSKC